MNKFQFIRFFRSIHSHTTRGGFMRSLTTAFLALLTILFSFFTTFTPAFAATTYNDLATMEADLGITLTQVDLTGTAGDIVPNGTSFGGITVEATQVLQFNSTGTQLCLVGDGTPSPVFHLYLPALTETYALEISEVDVYGAGIVLYDEAETAYDLIVVTGASSGTEFWGGVYTDPGTHAFMNVYSTTDTFCIGSVYIAPDSDGDSYAADLDCDDGAATSYPGALEVSCDSLDNDCDGSVDEDDVGSSCYDDDTDGYTEDDGDCNDLDATIHPGAEDLPDDGIDQDCDGSDATTPDDTGDSGIPDDDTGILDDTGSDTGEEEIKLPDGDIVIGCGCQVMTRFNWDHSVASLLLVGLVLMVARRRRE